MAPLRVALTGGIAAGKSHCLARFADLGAATIDADVLAREVVAPGTPGLAAVTKRFGPGVIAASGEIDREALGRVVFADAAARKDLEAIVHPLVYKRIERWFETVQAPVGIADIPLLYETGREKSFAAVIVASCPRSRQVERLLARGCTLEEAHQRLASQWPVETKAAKADYVIDTSGTFEETNRQVVEVWERLRFAGQRPGTPPR